jgi:hypothetical protein
MMTTFGPNRLAGFEVWCDEVPAERAQRAIAEVFGGVGRTGTRVARFGGAGGGASEETGVRELERVGSRS